MFVLAFNVLTASVNPFDTFNPEGTPHLSGVGELRPGQEIRLPQGYNQMIL